MLAQLVIYATLAPLARRRTTAVCTSTPSPPHVCVPLPAAPPHLSTSPIRTCRVLPRPPPLRICSAPLHLLALVSCASASGPWLGLGGVRVTHWYQRRSQPDGHVCYTCADGHAAGLRADAAAGHGRPTALLRPLGLASGGAGGRSAALRATPRTATAHGDRAASDGPCGLASL